MVKQPWLYLLGLGLDSSLWDTFRLSSSSSGGIQNLPGAEFAILVTNTIYKRNGIKDWPLDLTGRSDMAVFTRWQELATTPEGTAKMINLLWADLAASAVVGTKGIMQPYSSSSSSSITRQSPRQQYRGGPESEQPIPVVHVRPMTPLMRYHLEYGIPAYVLLTMLVALTSWMLIAWFTKMSTLDKIRVRMQQLSAGRIFTSVLYPGESDFRMPPRQWSRISGNRLVKFVDDKGGDAAAAEEMAGVSPEAEAETSVKQEQEEDRDPYTPRAVTISSVGSVTEAEAEEEMRPLQHDPYEGVQQQHDGYFALPPDIGDARHDHS